MKIALVHDEAPDTAWPNSVPEDFGAEYEDAPTIEAMLEAIRANCHHAVPLAMGEDFPARVRELGPEMVLNIAEGVRGPTRESIVPAWLDHLGVPYTGPDGLTLAMSLDKALTKTLAAAADVRTPAFRRVSRLDDLAGLGLEFPLFVKPNGEGSSMGVRRTSLVNTPQELRRQVAWVLETYREDCLVEEFAPGREFCVALLGNGEPEVLPIVEVRSPGAFYSYEDKAKHRKELLCPAQVEQEAAEEMRDMALEVFRALRCRDLARADFKVDAAGRPSFLEINPLPGLSPHYGIFPRQTLAAGYSYAELIGRLIDLAAERTMCNKEMSAT